MRCDATRAITFMMANAGSGRSYGFLGVNDAHHGISHHGDDAGNFAKLETIDAWEVSQLAYLLEQMQAVEEGDGTLLDNSMVFFSSEIEDGNSHAHRNLPIILAGRGGGVLNPGRHIVYPDTPPIANLFTSMLNGLGVEAGTFGDDGTGPLSGLG
jgi:hypothetical protein